MIDFNKIDFNKKKKKIISEKEMRKANYPLESDFKSTEDFRTCILVKIVVKGSKKVFEIRRKKV